MLSVLSKISTRDDKHLHNQAFNPDYYVATCKVCILPHLASYITAIKRKGMDQGKGRDRIEWEKISCLNTYIMTIKLTCDDNIDFIPW